MVEEEDEDEPSAQVRVRHTRRSEDAESPRYRRDSLSCGLVTLVAVVSCACLIASTHYLLTIQSFYYRI
jgi:hypothetical protein